MTAEAIYRDKRCETKIAAPEAAASGEVFLLADGRAGVSTNLNARASGDSITVATEGKYELQKSTSIQVVKGQKIYWDRSAGNCTPVKAAAGADFYVGVAAKDATLAATSVLVDLNVKPQPTIGMLEYGVADNIDVQTTGTATVTVVPGGAKLTMSATAEAQKTDLLTQESIPVTVPFIAFGKFAIYDVGDNAALDINIGIANATHASDADAITESLFVHLDGNALSLLVESDDGTTENAAADSTIDAVDNTPFDVVYDCRDLTDCKVYINGVRVMDGTTGAEKTLALGDATGPLKLLVHAEKTSDNTTCDVRVFEFYAIATDDDS